MRALKSKPTSSWLSSVLSVPKNAVANMESLVKRHGPALEAFLVLPIAAGFLLDFTNAAVISLSIRLFS